MTKPMNKKTLIIALAALIVVVAAFIGIWTATRPEAQVGDKTITVQIVKKDSDRTVTINTDAEMLRGALEQENLIQGDESEFGLFVKTVDGYTADDAAQEWWCFSKGGESLMTGVDTTPIADGEQYEITLKTGW